MSAIKALLLKQLISVLMGMLTPKLLKGFARTIVNWSREYVIGTENKVDDRIVLPLLDMIETTFDIPDEEDDA